MTPPWGMKYYEYYGDYGEGSVKLDVASHPHNASLPGVNGRAVERLAR